jgi:hypothetical protein
MTFTRRKGKEECWSYQIKGVKDWMYHFLLHIATLHGEEYLRWLAMTPKRRLKQLQTHVTKWVSCKLSRTCEPACETVSDARQRARTLKHGGLRDSSIICVFALLLQRDLFPLTTTTVQDRWKAIDHPGVKQRILPKFVRESFLDIIRFGGGFGEAGRYQEIRQSRHLRSR